MASYYRHLTCIIWQFYPCQIASLNRRTFAVMDASRSGGSLKFCKKVIAFIDEENKLRRKGDLECQYIIQYLRLSLNVQLPDRIVCGIGPKRTKTKFSWSWNLSRKIFIYLSYFPSPRKITLRINSFTYFIHEQSTASLSFITVLREIGEKVFID